MLNFVTFFLSRYIYQVNNFREFLNIILSSACIYTQLYHNLCYCSSAKCRFFVFFRVIFLIQAFVMYFHELKFHNNKFVKLITCSLLCQNVILNTGGENIYSRSHCTWYLTIPSDHPNGTKKTKEQINFKVSYFATYFIFLLLMYQTHLIIWVHSLIP